jgi:hypothetical protein
MWHIFMAVGIYCMTVCIAHDQQLRAVEGRDTDVQRYELGTCSFVISWPAWPLPVLSRQPLAVAECQKFASREHA